jgi:hypothetical protein
MQNVVAIFDGMKEGISTHSVPIEPEDVNKFPVPLVTQMIFSEKDPFGEHFPPKEAIVIPPPEGFPVEGAVEFFFKIKIDPGDIGAMVRDGHFWVSMIGTNVFPFRY